jgi:hypothetical protein
MFNLILFAIYGILLVVALFFVIGYGLILWDDISAERRYKSRRDI